MCQPNTGSAESQKPLLRTNQSSGNREDKQEQDY
jgi:hypothetical protein